MGHAIALHPEVGAWAADCPSLLVMAEFMATPLAAGGIFLATSIIGEPFELPVLSTGQKAWLEVDVTPEFRAAACVITDPAADVPHLAHGMVDTFEISAP